MGCAPSTTRQSDMAPNPNGSNANNTDSDSKESSSHSFRRHLTVDTPKIGISDRDLADLRSPEGDESYAEDYALGSPDHKSAQDKAAKKLQEEKEFARAAWTPEYHLEAILPPSNTLDTYNERATRVSKQMILNDQDTDRKTKIICTMGPKCWSEEVLGQLMDAGMNVCRFNFSHGSHEGHLEVLNRVRAVCKAKDVWPAVLLDTKGPEIRTAMLRDHQPIMLDKGQEIIVEAVGDNYTTFEGYKDDKETRIGLSYAKLCQSVHSGNVILLADGSISIEVLEILDARTLRGRVRNSKKLGERKNCNLPGVKVDIPVLTEKDIDDLQNFACKHQMDFVAASFVQSGADVQFIRKVLDDAGGSNIKIISKIENEAGLKDFENILKYTDGVMVARGDLGMEIPSEKVALAQKMMITKCNIAGKFVVTATQMLESMITSIIPTRAESTDVANAVFDGTDCVMLSGETANGEHPVKAVATMAAIVRNAELGVDYNSQVNFIRFWNNRGVGKVLEALESACSNVSRISIDLGEDVNASGTWDSNTVALILSDTGRAPNLVAKYRPPIPVIVASSNPWVLRQANVRFGQIPFRVDSLASAADVIAKLVREGVPALSSKSVNKERLRLIVMHGPDGVGGSADESPIMRVMLPNATGSELERLNRAKCVYGHPIEGVGTLSVRATHISLDLIQKPINTMRKTKICCTLGPKCASPETMSAMLDAGMDVARISFSQSGHAEQLETLNRYRKVCKSKGQEAASERNADAHDIHSAATLMDTKGREIRTGAFSSPPVEFKLGDKVIIHCPPTADAFASFMGGEQVAEDGSKYVTIAVSMPNMGQYLSKDNRIMLDYGTLSLRVEEVVSPQEVRCEALNSNTLGAYKNCTLLGVNLSALPVLRDEDIADIKEFAGKHGMDFVAAPFVGQEADVRRVREVLKDSGCAGVKVISRIETREGLDNFDEILAASDGILIARGPLGMEIPPEKVALAQKLMITKCNIAGKFVIVATHLLESMRHNPLPTRAEMTDVANAVLDGADCVMLSSETASGDFPVEATKALAAILLHAEQSINYGEQYRFIRGSTPKPLTAAEAVCSSAVKAAGDIGARFLVVVTSQSQPARYMSKYRPEMPVIVVTSNHKVARQASAQFGLVAMYEQSITSIGAIILRLVAFCKRRGLGKGVSLLESSDTIVLVHGIGELDNPNALTMQVADLGQQQLYKYAGYEGVLTYTIRSTKIGLDMLRDSVWSVRKTKIICTMGPKCWSEDMLGQLMDAGMNVCRFNFSHGSHEGHLEVLNRVRAVCEAKDVWPALLLDTKGPEIRTAMLRDHQPITLEKGQDIIVEAVGDNYTTFEGYKDDKETRIGLSYAGLCQSVKPGNRILLADGSISIEVLEILDASTLRGRVMNSKKLGERKNCNLPGVKVDIPVLTEKDIDDLQNFACKHQMDYVAASFVQSGADVQFIRRMLDMAGGSNIKIISKIENEAGLQNFDEILKYTDGVMVARGDLGMEIPSEKVALAQKWMITKCTVAGKFVITATQMLESMVNNPAPTRAESTDVANAVFDGTDCVMLSGETANGEFPADAVAVMAEIVRNAEIGLNTSQVVDFISDFTPKPLGSIEAVVHDAAKISAEIRPGLILAFSEDGSIARLAAKYRPRVPLLVVTSQRQLARHCQAHFGLYPFLLSSKDAADIRGVIELALRKAVMSGLCKPGREVIVLRPPVWGGSRTDKAPHLEVVIAPGAVAPFSKRDADDMVTSLHTTSIRLTTITHEETQPRKTKVMATVGPRSCSEEGIGALLDAGMDLARVNLAHGTVEEGLELIARIRQVAASRDRIVGILMDTHGPQIRSSKNQGGGALAIRKGQHVTIMGLEEGAEFDDYSSRVDDKEDRVHVGISYASVGKAVKPGDIVRMADGTVQILVSRVVSPREVHGVMESSSSLGAKANVYIRGVHQSLPTVTEADKERLLEVACKAELDFVAVTCNAAADAVSLRSLLNAHGGGRIKIVAKIKTLTAIANLDSILAHADGAMVARGDLGMEMPAEKVALAQKMIVTKCNIAGRFVLVSRQMLDSMIHNPLPTRAEMTDSANAIMDGADGTCLSWETSVGEFPAEATSVMAKICQNSEYAIDYNSQLAFIRDFSPHPLGHLEAMGLAAAKACIDTGARLAVALSRKGRAADALSKYRPFACIMVVTDQPQVARQTKAVFGQFPVLVDKMEDSVSSIAAAVAWARGRGLYKEGPIAVLCGYDQPDADCGLPVVRVMESA
eukprot:jgi/Mesvir1/4927/Mv25062-RA.1